MSAACHRSLYGYQLRTALALAVENRHVAVTFLPLACTGATIETGLFGSQGASECPPSGRCAGTVPPQIEQLQDALDKARKLAPDRKLDLVLLTVGANDIKFAGLVADVIISAGVERTLFNQGGQLATVPQAQAILDREFPNSFAKLRTAPEAAGRRQSVPRGVRVLRPSGDAGRRALPRRTRRPRRPSGVHRRRTRG